MEKMLEPEVSTKRVVANQANCQKSTGPKTPEGKARASLNSLKTGAYAKTKNALREIMLRKGENPADYEQFQQGLAESWHPDDLMQEVLVKTITEKSWEMEQLRAAWAESQLTALQVGQIQAQRRQLLARRWCPGALAVEVEARGLWLGKDRPSKFKRIFDLLDLLQKWFEDEVCPDQYPATMRELYGECPSQAGEKIRLLCMDFFGSNGEAAAEKAAQELPKWIAQERRDVQQERDLYQRETALRGNGGPNLTEEQVASKEAALARQIGEQTRLLLQLKTKRLQWGSRPEQPGTEDRGQGTGPEAREASSGPGASDVAAVAHAGPASSGPSGAASSRSAIPTNGPANGSKGDQTVADGAAIAEKIGNGSNEPS
jgi:hypothetical protein